MADFYALKEEELRLDNELSPFNFATFFISAQLLRKREKTYATVSVAMQPCPFIVPSP